MKHILLLIFPVFFYGASKSGPEPSLVSGHQSGNLRQSQTIYDHISTAFNRPAFYKAMEGNNKEQVNAELKELISAPLDVRDAFTGAMIMKKAGLGGSPVSKLHLFREGHKMLEAAIKQDPKNAEFRLLRLIIQENSPDFLGYKNDVEEDSEYIRKSYKSLPDEVQRAIADYSKKSKFLKLQVP
jgi:hypothetical protein